jgi:hypothetical protein
MSDDLFFTYNGQIFRHGSNITCKIDGNEVRDGKISIKPLSDNKMRVFLCQNVANGTKANELFGYKYSWTLGIADKEMLVKKLRYGVDDLTLKNAEDGYEIF